MHIALSLTPSSANAKPSRFAFGPPNAVLTLTRAGRWRGKLAVGPLDDRAMGLAEQSEYEFALRVVSEDVLYANITARPNCVLVSAAPALNAIGSCLVALLRR